MNQEYKEKLSRKIEKHYSDLEDRIMQDIIRRIRQYGKITSTADWQINRLVALGNSSEDIERVIKETLDASYPEMFELYDQVIDWEYVRNNDIYEQINAEFIPYEENEELQQMTEAMMRQTKGELENITKTMGFYLDYGGEKMVMTPLSEVYQGYLDNAIMDITSGAFDYNSVLRRTVTQLTNSGLRTIEFASGRNYRVNVAARMAVMTGVTQLAGHIADINAEKLQTEWYEVAWHSGARPTHAVWQGRWWTKEQLVSVCGLGRADGLEGVNCYHERYPVIPGISERNWTDEWLEEQSRKENTPKEWFGREYTTYEAKQKQRQMETAMRAQREKVKLLEKGDADPDEVMLARAKYQAQLDEYARFSKKMGLKQERERIYLDKKGFVASNTKKQNARYTSEMIKNADKDSKEFEKYKDILKGSNVNLATFRQIKYNNPKRYELLQGYKKAVDKGDIHALTGFNVYERVAADVEKNIVGITTSEGVKISSFTTHFIDRVIGQTEEPHEITRQGTPIADVKDALENPVKLGKVITMADGDVRQMYSGKLASVVISITDKRLIQATPRKEKK